MQDIIGKYTFLDPGDIMKWTRDAKYYVNINPQEGGGAGVSGGGEGGGIDID